MSASDEPLSAPWDYYARHATDDYLRRTDAHGQGREEQLWETLAMIERGGPFDAGRLDRIPQNRAKKHHRLSRRLAAGRRTTRGPEVTYRLDIADLAGWVRERLSPAAWAVEVRLAAGENLDSVAREYEVSVGALKVRACRWRADVRRRAAG